MELSIIGNDNRPDFLDKNINLLVVKTKSVENPESFLLSLHENNHQTAQTYVVNLKLTLSFVL